MKKHKNTTGICLSIICLKDPIWKFVGSETSLDASIGIGSKMAFSCDWMPQDNLVQRRRFSLCGNICNVLNQLADGVIYYYTPVFPHTRSQEDGALQYLTRIPTWWYTMSRLTDPVLISTHSTADAMVSTEILIELSKFLENPSRLVLCCSAGYRGITVAQPLIVAELSSQRHELAQLISWWGHRVWTAGRMPTIHPIERGQDEQWLADLYQRWDQEEERYLAMEARRQGLLPRHMRHPTEEEEAAAPRWRGEEEARWYDAHNFLEQSIEEAYTFGERIPVGTLTDTDGTIHLLYSDDEIIEGASSEDENPWGDE
jgi:hypothetical protein